MQTRTKNALAALLLVATIGLAVFAIRRGQAPSSPALASRALDAVPAGALLVAVADLDALRSSPIGPQLLSRDRDIPGLGKVRDVCGLDPMERVREIAVVVPAGGEEGDFGLVASGDVPDEEILACAAKVIEKRGGRPVITNVGSFRTVRDGTMILTGGEIAVKKGGPILLGAGSYLRAMIDASDGKVQSVRSSVAHARLAETVAGAAVRATIVLTPKQREDLAQSLAEDGGPAAAASIVAGAVGISVGQTIKARAVIACSDASACASLAAILTKTRDARAGDFATKLVGFSKVLEATQIQAQGESVQIGVELPADEALTLFDRLLVLRGTRHPMPSESTGRPLPSGAPEAPPPADGGAPDAMAFPPPDEVLTAKGDAGPPPRDAGARDASK